MARALDDDGKGADLALLEARLFESLVQVAFGRTEPTVAIKLMRQLEGVPRRGPRDLAVNCAGFPRFLRFSETLTLARAR
jgi:hypothetical protein